MLTLPIKKKWFDMICAGEKLEEYRALTSRYNAMFFNASVNSSLGEGRFWVRLRNGYRNDSPSVFAIVSNSVGRGRPEWGATPGEDHNILTMHRLVKGIELRKVFVSECGSERENAKGGMGILKDIPKFEVAKGIASEKYYIIDSVTGELLDDNLGQGYETEQDALNAWVATN